MHIVDTQKWMSLSSIGLIPKLGCIRFMSFHCGGINSWTCAFGIGLSGSAILIVHPFSSPGTSSISSNPGLSTYPMCFYVICPHNMPCLILTNIMLFWEIGKRYFGSIWTSNSLGLMKDKEGLSFMSFLPPQTVLPPYQIHWKYYDKLFLNCSEDSDSSDRSIPFSDQASLACFLCIVLKLFNCANHC